MALSVCINKTNPAGREMEEHGSASFPIACYADNLRVEPVTWHWHDDLELVLVWAGQSLVSVGKTQRVVRQGEGFFVNSGVLHAARDEGESACRFRSIVFHPRLLGSVETVFWQKYVQPLVANHALEGLILTRETQWQARVLEQTEIAWTQCTDEPEGYEFSVRNALSTIVDLIIRFGGGQCASPSAKSIRGIERIKQMLAFVREHCAEEISVAQIAHSASVSQSECLRCFQSAIGMPPIQYLKHYRMQKAAEMLRVTEEKISAVARMCGFQDASYFSREFMRRFGVSPCAYRRQDEYREAEMEYSATEKIKNTLGE